ncbi:MAG: hypothetical protein V1892_03810 [bacterium]
MGAILNFFQSKKNSLEILERLSELRKDISVITKLNLSQSFLAKLKEIDLKLNQKDNFLVFSETIPCMESFKKWEPKVPSPQKRIKTLKEANNQGLSTMVAIRPLIPDVPNEETRKIIEATKDSCYGYYSGPLYLKNIDSKLINKNDESLKIEKLQPHWMPEGNEFYKIEKEGQMDYLKNILKECSMPLFEGAADGIKYLREKYAKH